MKKINCLICGKYRKFKNPKISKMSTKTLVLSVISRKCKMKMKKYLKKKNQLRYQKSLVY